MGGKEKFASDPSARSYTEWIKALIFLLIGRPVAHFGVALFLLSELGTDTFTVFIQGLSRVSGLTVGTVHVIVLCILMAVMLMCTKGYVKPGTVVCAFCGGPIIDFFTWLFQAYINGPSALGDVIHHGPLPGGRHAGGMRDPVPGNVSGDQQQCRHRPQ